MERKSIITEGANAVMLDLDFGTYPYVTSSNTTGYKGVIFDKIRLDSMPRVTCNVPPLTATCHMPRGR